MKKIAIIQKRRYQETEEHVEGFLGFEIYVKYSKNAAFFGRLLPDRGSLSQDLLLVPVG